MKHTPLNSHFLCIRISEFTNLVQPTEFTCRLILAKFERAGVESRDVIDIIAYGGAVVFFFAEDVQVSHKHVGSWA
jgi:hypothetical protein